MVKGRIALVAILWIFSGTEPSSQPLSSPDAAEIRLALKRLNVLGSVLYVAAHPDDENTALLSYLEKGVGIRAAYLSVTRGEGGQNLIGSEQGELMGVIRTQELLAARRIDGAEQFFTRAIDFGYSKSSEEALRTWQKDSVLSDMVRVIRTFRPDVIITRFSPTIGGHGHHTASAILAREAFDAAADPAKFPEQLRYLRPWKPKRILFNQARFFGQQIDTIHSLRIDLGEYSPILGKSFTEISGLSRSMHKSQGFGVSQNRGTNLNYFSPTGGEDASSDLFEGINMGWSRLTGGEAVGKLLAEAERSFSPEAASSSVPLLLKAYEAMKAMKSNDPLIALKMGELVEVIRASMGIWVDAITSDYAATPGGKVTISASVLSRSTVPLKLARITSSILDTTVTVDLKYNVPSPFAFTLTLPASQPLTQPYWLKMTPLPGLYTISDPQRIGSPENQPALSFTFWIEADGVVLPFTVPVQYRWVDPVEGELYRPLEVRPQVSVSLDQRVYLFPSEKSKSIGVSLRAGAVDVTGNVRLKVPAGWRVEPEAIAFTLPKKYDEQTVFFTITPNGTSNGTLAAEAETNEGISTKGSLTIRYSHIPHQTIFPEAEARLVRFDLKRSKKTIGYIKGSGDAIPEALSQIGYDVRVISDADLNAGDLSGYEAIVAGIRAYNTRPQLRTHQSHLMAYVEAGGTYVVQYTTQQRGESDDIGPYRMSISRDRVTLEDAPVSFVDPGHAILNSPNKISLNDFQGWVQERGLYFADRWDSSQYTPLLACNDSGETSKTGGLLVTRYGKGVFIYTGYSFFRQLPAGNPGALRVFVNLIEARGTSARARR